jgi:hypothetical protein
MNVQNASSLYPPQFISTEELAARLALRPHSIRKRYCQTGAYFCLRPVKLPNGRLMWPADSVEQLARAPRQ